MELSSLFPGGHAPTVRHGADGVRLAALARNDGNGGGGMCKMESGGGPKERHSAPQVILEKYYILFNKLKYRYNIPILRIVKNKRALDLSPR